MKNLKGSIMVFTAAILWGISGTVAQFLFQNAVDIYWLVTIRLLSAGIILLAGLAITKGAKQLIFWRMKSDILQIVLFAIFGMFAVQFTYFASIEAGNSAVATLLQYLAPLIIMGYLIGMKKQWPTKRELMATVLAVSGLFLLLTNGNLATFTVGNKAIFWGIVSAFTLAFYTVYPVRLLKKFSSVMVTGWGMLIGGIISASIFQINPFEVVKFSGTEAVWVVYVILFGTVLPFLMFMESLKYTPPEKVALIACAEPIAAVFSAIAWLNVPFKPIQGLGTVLILLMVILLSVKTKEKDYSIQIVDERVEEAGTKPTLEIQKPQKFYEW